MTHYKSWKVLETVSSRLTGAQLRFFELFWPRTKLPLSLGKPENSSLLR